MFWGLFELFGCDSDRPRKPLPDGGYEGSELLRDLCRQGNGRVPKPDRDRPPKRGVPRASPELKTKLPPPPPWIPVGNLYLSEPDAKALLSDMLFFVKTKAETMNEGNFEILRDMIVKDVERIENKFCKTKNQ